MKRLLCSVNTARFGLLGLLLALVVPYSIFAQSATLGPVVKMIGPTNGAVYQSPATIQLLAKATSPTGSITDVSFFAGPNKIPGTVYKVILDPPGVDGVTGLVYLLNWTNVPGGIYALTAVATDNLGQSATSAPVDVSVLPLPLSPVVRITSPPNHAVFFQPSDIPLFAFAADISVSAGAATNAGFISNVEFYAGTNDLGSAQHVVVSKPGPPPIDLVLPNDWTLVWTSPPAGVFSLTAVATDSLGNTATSAPVNITIVPTRIITNGLDVVSIVASDPVAIAGTNCWVWPGLPMATPDWADWGKMSCIPCTNCGPKDATFTVRRVGDSSADLTVAYAISGSASNGVDYAMLPGTVTIPAGQNYAFINIVPLTNAPLVAIRTVVLTLQPPITAAPPGYIVGIPRSAAAIILDSSAPRPVSGMVPGSCFHLAESGPDGAWFEIESSTDLVNWVPVAPCQVIGGYIDYVDTNSAAGQSFYQAIPLTSTPLQ